MELLFKVIRSFFRSGKVSRQQDENLIPQSASGSVAVNTSREDGAKVAAIIAAMHFHAARSRSKSDQRAKVAAIAAAIHHHELEMMSENDNGQK